MDRLTEAKVNELANLHGYLKVNLAEPGSTNGEGVWAVCCSQEDKDIYDNPEDVGKEFKVAIANTAIKFKPVDSYRLVAVATNNGEDRPYINYREQFKDIDWSESNVARNGVTKDYR